MTKAWALFNKQHAIVAASVAPDATDATVIVEYYSKVPREESLLGFAGRLEKEGYYTAMVDIFTDVSEYQKAWEKAVGLSLTIGDVWISKPSTTATEDDFRWGQFLDERRRLIHYYHGVKGNSDKQIAVTLSMTPEQVAMIRLGTEPGPAKKG